MADKTAQRICIIDDETEFSELFDALFALHGFQVVQINDPLQGWERLQNEAFDAVILDIMMPGMTGLALVEKLRRTERYADAPLFILSAKRLTDEERKFLLTHKIHFVAKPFEARRLVETLREALVKK